MFRSSKSFRGFSCAHRKWRHRGHCAHVHGYSREFTFWFESMDRDENGFVMEFGALKPLKAWLDEQFDHTLLLDADDPLIDDFRAIERRGGARLNVLPDVSCEGTAHFVYQHAREWIAGATKGRVWIVSVECRENEHNSAIYVAPNPANHAAR
ncbi:MAG: 6-carboxytetrahydropterin synthase [Polyangiales bacterium]|nr:6-carboxytetrahydropterin synthase [Sandaracinaceae bacterium]